MDRKRHYSKRNRPVTACLECQRRKQKCDRKKPCDICVQRNVESRCIYGAENGTVASAEEQTTPEDQGPLFENLGYSSTSSGKEALDALREPTTPPIISVLMHNGQSHSSAVLGRLQRKHDALISRLPPSSAVEALVKNFYEEADWYFTVLDQPHFDWQLQEWNAIRSREEVDFANPLHTKPNPVKKEISDWFYFPAALFQVLAISLHFLPQNSNVRAALGIGESMSSDRLSTTYSNTGDEVLSLLRRHNSTSSAVLADFLRCTWLKNNGRGGESWFVLGDAIRQAQNLGLHLESEDDSSSSKQHQHGTDRSWHEEHQRRLWVGLFCWESHMALTLGRTRMINSGDCTVKDPDDCNFPLRPSNSAVPAVLPACPSFYTSQLVKYSIGKLIHEMITTGVLKSPLSDYDMVMRFHQAVIRIQEDLALPSHPTNPDTTWDAQYPNLLKQRLHILIMTTGCLVSLHRPHAITHLTSREVAIDASLKSLEAQQRLFEMLGEHQYRIHTLIFHTIDKSIFLTTMVIKHGHKTTNGHEFGGLPVEEIRIAVHQAATRLGYIKKRSNVAEVGERVVWHCHELVQLHQRKNQYQEGYNPSIFNVTFDSNEPVAQVNSLNQSPSLTHTSTGVSSAVPPTPSMDFEHGSGRLKLADNSRNDMPSSMHEYVPNILPDASAAMTRPKAVFAFPDAGFDDFWSGANFDTSAWLEEAGVMEDSFFNPEWEVE